MVVSPCLHPKRVYNATLGYHMNVNCGRCEACLVNNGRSLTDRVNDRFLTFRYRFMFTLTYDNAHLPLAKYDPLVDSYVSSRDADYNGVPYSVHMHDIIRWHNSNFVNKQVSLYGGVPVLSHRDFILFKKRLRKNLYKKLGYYEKNFVFICGEYGPAEYRPHGHGLFGTNDPVARDCFAECVREAWKVCDQVSDRGVKSDIGFIYVKECFTSGATDYCAKYLSCTTHLPFFLSKSVFRPFHSRLSNDFQYKYNTREFFDRLPVEKSVRRVSTSKIDTNPVTYSDYYFVFPKYSGFLRLDLFGRDYLFKFAKRFCGQRTAEESAKYLIDSYRTFVRLSSLIRDHQKVFYHVPMVPTAYDYLNQLYDFGSENIEQKLVLFFRVNRRINNIVNELNCSSLEYFNRGEKFFSKLQQFKLKKFYESLEKQINDPLRPLSLQMQYYFYLHTDDVDLGLSASNYYFEYFHHPLIKMDDIPLQADYSRTCKKILLDTTKTKKRNDDFSKRGIRKRAWLPVIKSKILKFT